jgi:glycosyltransferase involved in cell wall biosynthesis
VSARPSRPALPRGASWIERPGPHAEHESSRRALLLTVSYPPRTEVGAARWEGFTPFLTRAGWGVDAVIEERHPHERTDMTRLARLPADVRVAETAHKRAWWHAALLGLRGALKRRRGTVAEAPVAFDEVNRSSSGAGGVRTVLHAAVHVWRARTGLEDFSAVALALADTRHRVVISSGPPHYVHVAASRIARRLRVPHVVDLRDPWGHAEHRPLSARLLPDRHLLRHEARTLRASALVLTNTEAAQRALVARLPELAERVRCIPNGSDVEPLDPAALPRPSVFRIAHSGSLYLDRDPRPFFRAVGRVRERLALGPDTLRVVFMGNPARVEGRALTDLADESGLRGVFEERAAGTRDEARALLTEASMAVAFQGETRTQVPAKVFEYVAFPLWLLALVGAGSATADALADTEAIVLDIDDEAGIERAVERCYRAYLAGERPRAAGWDGRFSRARQAERLLVELERIAR